MRPPTLKLGGEDDVDAPFALSLSVGSESPSPVADAMTRTVKVSMTGTLHASGWQISRSGIKHCPVRQESHDSTNIDDDDVDFGGAMVDVESDVYEPPTLCEQSAESESTSSTQQPDLMVRSESIVELRQGGPLGAGACGSVTRAVFAPSPQEVSLVALKYVRVNERSLRHQLFEELGVLARVKSPYILQFKGAFASNDAVCVALEFARFGSLDDIGTKLGQQGREIPEAALRHVARGLFHALADLTSARLVHRDIKPANVLAFADGSIKVADFGIAKPLEGTLAMAKTMIGTFDYMAPERLRGDDYDGRGDVWSAGCLLHALANVGTQERFEAPFTKRRCGGELGQLHAAQTHTPPVLGAKRLEQPSKEMQQVIAACLQKQPQQRATASHILGMPWFDTDLQEDLCAWRKHVLKHLCVQDCSDIEKCKELARATLSAFVSRTACNSGKRVYAPLGVGYARSCLKVVAEVQREAACASETVRNINVIRLASQFAVSPSQLQADLLVALGDKIRQDTLRALFGINTNDTNIKYTSPALDTSVMAPASVYGGFDNSLYC